MAFLYPTAVRCDYVHKQCLRESDFTSSLVLRVQQSPQRRSRRSSVVLSAHLSRRVFLSYALSAAFAPLLRTPARAEYNIEPQALDKVPELESSALGNGTAFGFRLPIDQAEQSRSIRQPSEEPDPRVRMQVFERRPRGSRAHKFKTGDESDDDSSSPSGPLVPGTVRLRVGKGIDRLDHRGKENERRAYEDLQAYESVEGLTEYDEDARVPVDYDDAITIRPDENYGDSFVGFLHTSAITAGAVLAVASLIALAERTSTSRRDAIPLEYNRKRIARYCLMRPERVIMRVSKYALEIMRYTSIVAWHAFLDGIRAGGRAAKRARRKRRARNLREGITRLGPGLIKLGQAAATRPDLFGETFTSELQLLQDSLFQGFESTEAFDLIRDELDAPLRSVFAYIEPKPVAGASLGMVFKAWLVEKRKEESHVELAAKNQDLPSAKSQEDNLSLASVSAAAESSATTEQKFGDHAAYMPRTWVQSDRDQILRWRWERPSESYLSTRQQVAIKVQRPHVAELMTLDFFIVRGIASFAARILNIRTDLGGAVDEYASSTFEELNYTKEASNMQRFREMYGTTPGVYIPEVYPLYSSRRVLVSEWIDGIKLTDKRARVRAQDIGIVETGIRSALDQCLSGGFMHCDLHNGNILRLKQDLSKLAFIDFGICASIPEYTRQCTVCALLHLIHHDYEALADTFAGMSLMRAVDLEKELPLLSTALGRALEPNGGNNGDGGDIEESRQSSVSENSPTSSRQPMGSSSKKTLLTEELTVQQMAPLFTQTNVRDKSDEDRVKCADTVDSTAISPEEERAFDVYEKLPTVSKFTFIGVADKLIRLSGQFPLVFRDYFLSNIKSLAMLEVSRCSFVFGLFSRTEIRRSWNFCFSGFKAVFRVSASLTFWQLVRAIAEHACGNSRKRAWL